MLILRWEIIQRLILRTWKLLCLKLHTRNNFIEAICVWNMPNCYPKQVLQVLLMCVPLLKPVILLLNIPPILLDSQTRYSSTLTHSHTRTHTHTHTYTHTYTHIHTYIHTHTHIHTHSLTHKLHMYTQTSYSSTELPFNYRKASTKYRSGQPVSLSQWLGTNLVLEQY